MCNIAVISDNSPTAKLVTRPKTHGAELDFSNRFIEHYVHSKKASRLKSDIAIYVEPKIDSGYPDIVIAQYDKSFMSDWCDERHLLCDDDLRIMSFLIKAKGANIDTITQTLGFSYCKVSRSVELLCDCRMVARKAKKWVPVRLGSYFGVKKLVAIEAKVSAPREALDQAVRNTRFASHSYALLGANQPALSTLDLYQGRGIGIIAGERFTEAVKPVKYKLPTSYVTLKFNEWIGRQLDKGEII